MQLDTAPIVLEIFAGMLRDRAYDVSELVLTFMLRSLQLEDPPVVALPIFPARIFRHSAVYVNVDSGIEQPEDLAGKTVGEFALYGQDAGLWAKGVLSDEYGFDPARSRWVIGSLDQPIEPLDFVPQPQPEGVEITRAPEGKALGPMLEAGEIDALFSANAPQWYPRGLTAGAATVRGLRAGRTRLLPAHGNVPDHAHGRGAPRARRGAARGRAGHLRRFRRGQGRGAAALPRSPAGPAGEHHGPLDEPALRGEPPPVPGRLVALRDRGQPRGDRGRPALPPRTEPLAAAARHRRRLRDGAPRHMSAGPVIATEEHFVTGEVLDAWGAVEPAWRDLSLTPSREGQTAQRLAELGPRGLEAMDDLGIETQVLSLGPPGLQNPTRVRRPRRRPARSLPGLRDARYPGPGTTPRASWNGPSGSSAWRARCSTDAHGSATSTTRTSGRSSRSPPTCARRCTSTRSRPCRRSPPPAVRAAYYEGYDPGLEDGLATFGMGWHYEAGVQFVRMVLSGVFDRFPDLRVVLGHWGEVALFYLDRVDELAAVADITRAPSEYARSNLFVTAGGLLSQRYLRWSIKVLGVERVLFASDYPFAAHAAGDATRFLERSGLSDGDQALIAHDNWTMLREGIRR